MLRHPPASLVITHKDVDNLATMQRRLLDRTQHGTQPETPSVQDKAAGDTVPRPRGARQVSFDAHDAERQRRQQLS
ncbi:hypothetical protein IWW38_003963, partial [Coemansia aciculifera]